LNDISMNLCLVDVIPKQLVAFSLYERVCELLCFSTLNFGPVNCNY
jgi:hypothetical protein